MRNPAYIQCKTLHKRKRSKRCKKCGGRKFSFYGDVGTYGTWKKYDSGLERDFVGTDYLEILREEIVRELKTIQRKTHADYKK